MPVIVWTRVGEKPALSLPSYNPLHITSLHTPQSFLDPLLSLPFLLPLSLPLSQLLGFGERCKLPQLDLGQNSSQKWIWSTCTVMQICGYFSLIQWCFTLQCMFAIQCKKSHHISQISMSPKITCSKCTTLKFLTRIVVHPGPQTI